MSRHTRGDEPTARPTAAGRPTRSRRRTRVRARTDGRVRIGPGRDADAGLGLATAPGFATAPDLATGTGTRRARLVGDRRGVSELLGLILAFGIVVALVALLQVAVVPAWDASEEYDHSLRVREDVAALDDAVGRVAATGVGERPTVETGVAMPSAGPLLRSPPVQGTLRTVDAGDVTVSNATAVDPVAARFWTGDDRRYDTVTYEYAAPYGHLDSAPTYVGEAGTVYALHGTTGYADVERFVLVNGDRVTVVAMEGPYASTAPTVASVPLVPLSTGGDPVAIRNVSGRELTISVPTRMGAAAWASIEADTPEVVAVRYEVTGGDYDVAHVVLADGTYELSMARVGLDTPSRPMAPAYVIDVAGDGSVVPANGTGSVVVEVRDAYNNPVSGVDLRASNLSMASATVRAVDGTGETTTASDGAVVATDERGRARFEFRAPGLARLSGPTTATFDVTIDDAASVHPDAPPAASRLPVTIHVQGTGFPSLADPDAADVADDGTSVVVSERFRAVVSLLATEDSSLRGSDVEYTPLNVRVVAVEAGATTPTYWYPWPGAPVASDWSDVLAANVNDPRYAARSPLAPDWTFVTPALDAGSSVSMEIESFEPDAIAGAGTYVTVGGSSYEETYATGYGDRRVLVDTTATGDENVRILRDGDVVPNPDAASAVQLSVREVLGDRVAPDGTLVLAEGEFVVLFELTGDVESGTANGDFNDAIALVRIVGA